MKNLRFQLYPIVFIYIPFFVFDLNIKICFRIRPQSHKERAEMCKICTFVTPKEPQINLGHKEDKSFTFDYVYDVNSNQKYLFDSSVKYLVDGCLEGYNATVLAYGQTGSGKTYTMGTTFDAGLTEQEEGILPRAITYLFERIEQKSNEMKSNGLEVPEFTINAQFIELYNEEVIDLLDSLTVPLRNNQLTDSVNESTSLTPCNTSKNKIEIHEDQFGGIYINGCTNLNVSCVEDVRILKLFYFDGLESSIQIKIHLPWVIYESLKFLKNIIIIGTISKRSFYKSNFSNILCP